VIKVSSFQQFSGSAAIKQEIYTNGPVQTGFTVYQDFFSYSSGVYRAASTTKAGGHAVEIVGWNSDSKGEYWIVKNSWGTGWGLDGYFQIYTDQCGISSAA
jgi:cathepsin B